MPWDGPPGLILPSVAHSYVTMGPSSSRRILEIADSVGANMESEKRIHVVSIVGVYTSLDSSGKLGYGGTRRG